MAYREQIQAISILKPHLKIIPFPIHTALNLTNASIEYGIGQPARSQAKREAGQICSESKRRQSVPVLRRSGTLSGRARRRELVQHQGHRRRGGG